jgi:hypothetical protein
MNRMRKMIKYFARLILIGLCLQPGICGAEWSKEDRLQEKQQLDLWQKKLSEIDNLHGQKKIEELSLGLRSMAFRKEFGDRDPRTDLLYSEIQAALLAIPGHAEYYRDRILHAQERYKNPGGGTTWSDYHKELGNGFQILPHLHSPEGVRVLGELFSNEWVPLDNETAVASEKFVPLSVSARVTLQKFPLLNKPFKEPITQGNRADAQAAWQLWYEQIKSGKRTFRFEGDPTEYDLNGPAPGQKLAHISRDRKRDAERTAGHGKTSGPSAVAEPATASKPSQSMPLGLLIAGMVLLVSLGWYFLRGRSRERS